MKRLLSISALAFAGLCLSTPLSFSQSAKAPSASEIMLLEDGDPLTPLTGITATPYNEPFDGTSHTITVQLTGDAEEATLLYGETEGDYTLTEAPGYIEPGTHTIYFKASKEGYEDYVGSANVTITRKAITVTADAKSKHVGTAEPELTFSVGEGVVSGYDLPTIAATRDAGETAGEYDIKLNFSESAIYDISAVKGTFTITDHTFASEYTVIKAATCGKKGSQAKFCTYAGCTEHTESEEIPATGLHSLGESVTIQAATCTEDGESTRTCSVCNHIEHVVLPKLGHDFATEFTTIKEATCGEKGSQAKYCRRTGCTEYTELTEIEATGNHSYGSSTITVQKTCTTDGTSQRICSVCGDIQIITNQATGHVYSDEYTIDIEPTCTTAGEKSLHCYNCAERKAESITAIEALGHNWNAGTTTLAATCTEDGSIHYECTRCTESKDEPITKLGHDFSESFTVDLAATCTTDGAQSQHCQRTGCAVTQNTTPIPATGHDWGEPTTLSAPTCTLDGEEKFTCATCQADSNAVILAIGHDFSEEYTEDVAATCLTAGSKSQHCQHSGCSEKDNVTEIAALGHNLSTSTITINPGCTTKGEETFYCSRCDYSEAHEVASLGHQFSDTFTVDQRASCIDDGYESRHCLHDNCEVTTEGRIIPHGEHLWINEETIMAATCTKDGRKKHQCEACGIEEEYVVALLGHDYKTEFTIDMDATCEKMGTKSRHCTRCSSKIGTTYIPAKGHTEGATKRENIVEATCTEDGHYDDVLYCATCGKVMNTTNKTTDAIGHNYKKANDFVTAPACETEGLLYSTCIHCGDVKTDVVEALGHDYDTIYTVDKAPMCTELGIESKHCSRCESKIEQRTIASLGHAWNKGDTTTAPTCTTLGTLTKSCERCTSTYKIELDSLGHLFDTEYTIDTAATCLKEGEKSIHCSRCTERKNIVSIPMTEHEPGSDWEKVDVHPATCTTAETYKEAITCHKCGTFLEAIDKVGEPAKGHSWDNGTINVAPTCTEGGKMTFICTECAAVDIREVEPLGHTYTDTFTVDIPAKCLTEGSQSHHCIRCDIHGAATVIPAKGHTAGTPVKENVIEPKCTTQGSYESVTYCAACNILMSRDTVITDSIGHIWNETIEKSKATCTEIGITIQTCKTCMFTLTAKQAPLGHAMSDTFIVDTPARCGVEGLQSKHCARCDHHEEESVIPALEHIMGESEIVNAPKCLSPGESQTVCLLCGYTEKETLKALGHTFGEMEVLVEPSCEMKGMTGKKCIRCELESNIIMTPVLGHLFTTEPEDSIQPTCTEAGIARQFCDRCEQKIDQPIDSLGHSFPEVYVVDLPATCEEAGISSKHCDRCGIHNDTIYIEPIGHLWNEGAITTAPTDTTYGTFTYDCLHAGCLSHEFIQLDKLVALLPNELGQYFGVKIEGYCQGDEEHLAYNSNPEAGAPKEYRISFNPAAKLQGFIDVDWTEVPFDEQIAWNIPVNCSEGTYGASITFRNEDSIASAAIDFNFVVNRSQAATIAIFRDVVSVIKDSSFTYNSYQWYHNDEKIDGATLPYYQEKDGLSGSYYVVINEGTESEVRTCARSDWYNPLNKCKDVIITPNPVKDYAHIKLYNFENTNHKVTLYNEYGILMHEMTLEGDEGSVPTYQLVSGQYLIKVDGITTKVVKQ